MITIVLALMACSGPDAPQQDTMTAPSALAGRYAIDAWTVTGACGVPGDGYDTTDSRPRTLRLVPIADDYLQATVCEPGDCGDSVDPWLGDAELLAVRPGEWLGGQIETAVVGEGTSVCEAWYVERTLYEHGDGRVELMQTTHLPVRYGGTVEGLCELDRIEQMLVESADCAYVESIEARFAEATEGIMWTVP